MVSGKPRLGVGDGRAVGQAPGTGGELPWSLPDDLTTVLPEPLSSGYGPTGSGDAGREAIGLWRQERRGLTRSGKEANWRELRTGGQRERKGETDECSYME